MTTLNERTLKPESLQSDGGLYDRAKDLPEHKAEQADGALAIGSLIEFGGNIWRVLDIKGETALLITKAVIHVMPYNAKLTDVTWEKSTMRKWLNDDFYSTFSQQEQSRIALANIETKDNPWYGTSGGNSTKDKIFLLSIEEVVKYFGDSGDLENKQQKDSNGNLRSDGYCLFDQYNQERVAEHKGSVAWWAWWWLRTAGNTNKDAVGVLMGGAISVDGYDVSGNNGSGGVRPALWLKLPI